MALKPVTRSRSVSTKTQAVVSDIEKKWGDESPLLAEAVDLLATVAGRKTRRADMPPAKIPAGGDKDWQMKDYVYTPPRTTNVSSSSSNAPVKKPQSSTLTTLRSSARQVASNADSSAKQAQVTTVACELAAQNIKTGAANSKQLSMSLNEVSRQISQLPKLTAQSIDRVANAGAGVDEVSAGCQQLTILVQRMSAIAKQFNALSFNATMESSRPGVGGSSFAVITAEMQKLSKRLARAGKMVRRQLAVVHESACTASQTMEDTTESLKSMSDIATRTQRIFNEKRATAESVARDLSDAVNALDEATGTSNRLSQSMAKCATAAQQAQTLADKLAQENAA